jgi:hypothetical protein
LSQPGEIFGKGCPFPFNRLAQHLRGHRFDPHKRADDVVAVFRTARREREAAVSRNQGRDAMKARRCREGIPEQLGIHMGVEIDEAGRQGQPLCVNNAVSTAGHPSHLGYPVTDDGNVAHTGWQPAAVVDPGAFNNQIVSHHGPPSTPLRSPLFPGRHYKRKD